MNSLQSLFTHISCASSIPTEWPGLPSMLTENPPLCKCSIISWGIVSKGSFQKTCDLCYFRVRKIPQILHACIHIPNDKIDGLVWSANYEKSIGKQLWDYNETKISIRVVLCSFCVDAPRAHQKWDADSTYIASASWQVVKDYIILLTVLIQLCARHPSVNCLCLEIPCPTQSLRIWVNGKIMSDWDGIDELL